MSFLGDLLNAIGSAFTIHQPQQPQPQQPQPSPQPSSSPGHQLSPFSLPGGDFVSHKVPLVPSAASPQPYGFPFQDYQGNKFNAPNTLASQNDKNSSIFARAIAPRQQDFMYFQPTITPVHPIPPPALNEIATSYHQPAQPSLPYLAGYGNVPSNLPVRPYYDPNSNKGGNF